METARPTKRRRVDENHVIRKPAVGKNTDLRLSSNHAPENCSHRSEPRDVYDDIEGAHSASTTSISAKRQRIPSGRAPLDPLRNQGDGLSTPTKPSARVIASLGIFKPFCSPEKASSVLGTESQHKKNEEYGKKGGRGSDTLLRQPPARTSQSARKHISNTNEPSSIGLGGHRTYEDEIKAVAEAARKSAQNGDDESWNVLHRPKRSKAGIHHRHHDLVSPRQYMENLPSLKERFSDPRTRTPSRIESCPNEESKSPLETRNDAGTATSPDNDEGSITVGNSSTRQLKVAGTNRSPIELSRKKFARNLSMPAINSPSQPVKQHQAHTAREGGDAPTPVKGRRAPGYVKPHVVETPKHTKEPLLNVAKATSMIHSPKAQVKRSHVRKTYTFEPHQLAMLKDMLLMKHTGRRPIPSTGIPDEYSKVSTLITQTVEAGESNSMLIIGARGTGKTTLVEQIVREQIRRTPNDFFVVRLNGFIHTDDKIALRDIWRQLGREMDLNEEDHTIKNYADTMSSLLALLSHSPETNDDRAVNVTKSVLFIIDEFDLFTQHPRQTLLYNLFDIAQSRKAPIAVIGLTTRVDVTESLEKRVKSRFSHRYIHLSFPKSFNAFCDICKAALTVEEDELTRGETNDEGHVAINAETIYHWNAVVEDFVLEQPATSHLQSLFHTTKSIPQFLAAQYMALAQMDVDHPVTTEEMFEYLMRASQKFSLQPPDSSLDMLQALSSLQLALLICAARLNVIYDSESITFAMVYDEYKTLASKAKLQASASGVIAQGAGGRVSGKGMARDAWSELIEYGLILDDGRGNGKVDVGLEEIGLSGADLGLWARWCKEI